MEKGDKGQTQVPPSAGGASGRLFSSLKFRIVLVTLGILVVTVWALMFHAASVLRQDMEQTLSDQQFATASSLASHVEEGVRQRIDVLENVAASITPEMLAHPREVQRYLDQRIAILRLYNLGIYVIAGDGRGIAEKPALGRIGADFTQLEYFGEIMAGARQAISKPRIGRFAKEPVVVFAVPIKDGRGNPAGILAGGIRLDGKDIFSRVAEAGHGKDGHAFLLSARDRLVVISSRPGWVLKPVVDTGVNQMLDRFLAGEDGSGVARNFEGKEILISGKNIPGTRWLVTVSMPTSEAFAPVEAMERRIYLSALVLTLFVGFLMWLFVRRELQPLEKSVSLIRQMSQGSVDLQPIPLQGNREIRELQQSFNQLQERIAHQQEIISRQSKRNALFLSVASDGIHILDDNGDVVEASAMFCRMLGYSHEEVIGMNIACWEARWTWKELQAQLAHNFLKPSSFQTRHRRRDGTIFDVELQAVPFHLDGRPMLYASSRDITERKEAEARIYQLAFFDPLTDLPNRRLFLDRLSQALAASRRSGEFGALIFLDLDHFKTLNDTQGHDTGDQLLVQVAQRLRACVRQSDTVARLGGDEFVVMLEDLRQAPTEAAAQAENVAEKIKATLNLPYVLGEHEHRSTASMGISLFPDGDASGEEVLKRADLALYQAKDAGRNSIRFYSPTMQAVLAARAELEASLHRALAGNELLLYYQPQIDRHGRVMGTEALLRWRHPSRGLILPGEFIALAEESGLIVPIGRWVLQSACRQLARWQQAGHAKLQIAVNVSARQFRQADFVEQVRADLAESRADPTRLKLELTESLVLENIDDVIAKMQALKAIGVSFAMDDFGTGYSSFSYLKRLPLDQLKIDRAFVRDLATDPDDAEIVRAILAMSHTLRLQVVAEGVETEVQRRFLEQHGCEAFQGYLFSHPLPVEEFTTLLERKPALLTS